MADQNLPIGSELPDCELSEIDTLKEALGLLNDVLRLVDRSSAPGDIGAHLDFAGVRLAAYVARIDQR